MSERRLLDPREAEAVRNRLFVATMRWVIGGVVGSVLSLLLVIAGMLGGAMVADHPTELVGYSMLGMVVGTAGGTASLLVPLGAIARLWWTSRNQLAEAKRVLSEPVTTDPAWARLEAQIRACLGRTDDPDLRARLQDLHGMLEHEFRVAATLEPGSEADHRFRDLLGRARRAVQRLQDSLATPSVDARELVALLEARAEVEAPERKDAARRARPTTIG